MSPSFAIIMNLYYKFQRKMFCRRGTSINRVFHQTAFSIPFSPGELFAHCWVSVLQTFYWLVNLCFHNAVQICFYSALHLSISLPSCADRRHASCQAATSARKHNGNTGFPQSLECTSGFFDTEINKIIITTKKTKNPKQSEAKMDLI